MRYLLCVWRYWFKIAPDLGDILTDYPQTNSTPLKQSINQETDFHSISLFILPFISQPCDTDLFVGAGSDNIGINYSHMQARQSIASERAGGPGRACHC